MFWFWIILNGNFCTCIGVCPFVKLLLTSTIKKNFFFTATKRKILFFFFWIFFKVSLSLIKLSTIFSIHKDHNLFSSHSILHLTTLTPRLFFKNWINIFSCLRFDWVVKTVMLTLFQKRIWIYPSNFFLSFVYSKKKKKITWYKYYMYVALSRFPEWGWLTWLTHCFACLIFLFFVFQ